MVIDGSSTATIHVGLDRAGGDLPLAAPELVPLGDDHVLQWDPISGEYRAWMYYRG